MDDLTPIGFYNFRNQQKKFGIKIDDRRRHIYVVGKTGVGKSTLLENMTIADMQAGRGVAVIDPHGEFAEKMLDFVPEERLNDVIYFDPSDMEFPIAFNPMEQVGSELRHLVASGLMGVFKKIWADAWSARMQYILNNTLLALLELPGATLLGILRMFSDPEYRRKIVENLQDPVIKAFWRDEFSKYSQKFETEALAAIQNKVGQFVSNPLVRNILGQPRSTLNMRQIMDTGKIFIANLSKGKIGEDNSALLGAMIITRLQLAAMSRVDLPESQRPDFFMYVDEFQNFATDSFASILSEARKYHLSLTLAHQYIGQLISSDGSTKIRDAVFGNVGTIITFRVGAEDGEFLEKEFMPEFLQTDLVNLAKANIYVKLMIDGVASRPFSAETVPPQKTPLVSYRDVIIKNSREHYGTPRKVVESRIAEEWLARSESAVQEKVGRRDERRLSEVLRPNTASLPSGSRPPRFDERPRPSSLTTSVSASGSAHAPVQAAKLAPAVASATPGESSQTTTAPAAKPARRMQDVEPQGAKQNEPIRIPSDSRESVLRNTSHGPRPPAERPTMSDVSPVSARPDAIDRRNGPMEKSDFRDSKVSKQSIDIGALRLAIKESLQNKDAKSGSEISEHSEKRVGNESVIPPRSERTSWQPEDRTNKKENVTKISFDHDASRRKQDDSTLNKEVSAKVPKDVSEKPTVLHLSDLKQSIRAAMESRDASFEKNKNAAEDKMDPTSARGSAVVAAVLPEKKKDAGPDIITSG